MNKKTDIIDGSILFDKFDNSALIELYDKSIKNGIQMFYKNATNEYVFFTYESIIVELKKRNANINKTNENVNISVEPVVFQED